MLLNNFSGERSPASEDSSGRHASGNGIRSRVGIYKGKSSTADTPGKGTLQFVPSFNISFNNFIDIKIV